MQSEPFRSNGHMPSKREPQAPLKGAPTTSNMASAPQTPSTGASGLPQPIQTEPNIPMIPVPRVQQLPPALPQAGANRPHGPLVPLAALPPNKVVAPDSLPQLNQTKNTAPGGTPPLDSSNTAEHNPPVGFFTARAAESLQKGPAQASNVPAFNPHLESPSIRKTAGVDHSKTKPVRTESLGGPPAVIPPRTNFVNPQADKTRRVGMPMGAASPLQNRGSYKPPQIKRPIDRTVNQ